MAVHAENTLRSPGIAQVFYLPLAVAALEAIGAECLVACKDREVLNLVVTAATAVGAIVADEGAIAEEKQVRI